MAVIKNAAGTNTLDVDSSGNGKVNLPTDVAIGGFATATGEVHDGTTGAARLCRPIDISPDYRTRVGTDSLLWQDGFNHAQLNLSKYQCVSATATVAVASGGLLFNNGNSVASAAVARVQTYKTFPLIGSYPTYVDIWGNISQIPTANSVVEFGVGYAATTAAPTDGVFFRLNGASSFQGVINFNGSETTTGALTVPTANNVYHWLIVIHNDRVEFWQDDELLEAITVPATAGTPCYSSYQPLLIRLYNSGVTAVAQTFRVTNLSITQGDLINNRLWATAMSGSGNASINIPDGVAAGITANYTNSAAPASATLANTTAGYATLGGQWQFAAVAGAETDYALFAYLVPAGTAVIPGKTLIVRGVRIESMNTVVAVATTATVLQWGVAVGSTAVSLATADSSTAGTRAPRRIPIGMQTFPVGATVGAMASTIDVNLDAPVMVEPGTYFHIILKMPIATATATEIFRGICFINGFFE